jgi:hypothetical protein
VWRFLKFSGSFNKFQCLFECTMNSTNIFQNRDNAEQICMKNLAKKQQAFWKDPVFASMDFCLDQVTKNDALLKKQLNNATVNGVTVCKSHSLYLCKCMFIQQMANCPGKDKAQGKCLQILKYFDECKDLLLVI